MSVHFLSKVPVWQQVVAPYSLGYRIRLLSQMTGRSLQKKLEPYGLTPFHWVVLCCLWENDGLATFDIVDRLKQVGGTMTGVISRMEERDLVYRAQDERDRRIWRVWLTQTGRQLQQELPDVAAKNLQQVLNGFSEQEQKQFSELVDKAIANLSR
ncbi:MAG: MarR family transcriptional regulator [Phormidesmis priestleyi]|uniref:MarR family transcriptional regulator n=1 Tax=Phormidesmis priestleyi TaxID=268141 RepID=A0A2W4WPG9_9CYAN|nr:MAG: MarR family transcriptional regulator [Phormidesmis priestleyi]